MGLAAIDIFPHQLTTRINYNGREDVKTHMGGFCTIFYVFCLIAITVYFAVPIVQMKDQLVDVASLPQNDHTEIFWSEHQMLWFEIQYYNYHYKLS